jgi:ABC-type transporter MlaC component
MRHPRVHLTALATSAFAACAVAVTPAAAQHHGGGGIGRAPHFAAPAAPHVAAPAAPHFAVPVAPHFSAPVAPHFSAPVAAHFAAPQTAPQITAPRGPHIITVPQTTTPQVAPHVATPHVMPQITAPRGPHIITVPQTTTPQVAPHVATPHVMPQITSPTPQQSVGPSVRYVPPRNLATPTQPGGPLARNLTQPLRDRGAAAAFASAPNLRGPNQTVLAPAADRPFAARALTNRVFANRVAGLGGTVLAHRTFQGAFARRHHHFFPIVIGWIGPLFWPYAYNDFLDYTFYPYGYDTFWPYAYDDVYQGIFGRYAYDYGSAYAAIAQPSGGGVQVPSSGGSVRRVGTDLCSSQVAGLTDWPIEQIAQTVEPDDAQRALLDDVRAASAKVIDTLKASCPTDLPSTPTGRIAAMHTRLSAMLDAVRTARPAFEKFYQSLNDEQKARLNALGPDEQDQQQAQQNLAQLCNQRASGIASLPIERIERLVPPDDAQRDALQELQDATAQAVNLLQSDCPTEQPLTMPGRLAAMEQRLDTMLHAVELVRPALERFYSSLSDEQKERFNRLTPVQG